MRGSEGLLPEPGRRRATLFLVLQLLVALLPAADALAAEYGQSGPPHFETRGSHHCPPVHDPMHCQLCRLLTRHGAAPRSFASANVEQTYRSVTELPATGKIGTAGPKTLPLGSRAPPASIL